MALLKTIPTEDYLQIERKRKEKNAIKIQRFWRNRGFQGHSQLKESVNFLPGIQSRAAYHLEVQKSKKKNSNKSNFTQESAKRDPQNEIMDSLQKKIQQLNQFIQDYQSNLSETSRPSDEEKHPISSNHRHMYGSYEINIDPLKLAQLHKKNADASNRKSLASNCDFRSIKKYNVIFNIFPY